VPSLYFAQGIPYVVVMIVSVIMYKRLGISNTDIALYTSWLYLPWVIKPLWSPIVDILKTRRLWIVSMQLLVGAGLAGVALTIPTEPFFQYTLAFLWLLAFSSATHDIAADGFYMLALSERDQAWFVGIRSTFYRLAMITGQGILVILAGYVEGATGLPTVDLEVRAVQATEAPAPPPAALPEGTEALRVVAFPASLDLALAPRRQADVDSVVAAARAWNAERGFSGTDAQELATAEDPQGPEGPSWWARNVAEPLEGMLRRWFRPEEPPAAPDRAGNFGVVEYRLTGPPPPGERIVVNVAQAAGDRSVRLVEGERFVFTEANWQDPARAVFQLDHRLEVPSEARFAATSGNIPLAWAITFYLLTGLFVLAFVYHRFVLPRPVADVPKAELSVRSVFSEFLETFASFFRKPGIGIAIAFLLLYRFGEAQLVKLASPFLLDGREIGGLAMTTGEVGFVYGTVGVLMLTLGGIIGGFLAARDGLKRWLWPMVIAINLPNLAYAYLAFVQPESFLLVNLAVAVEQFGYGFGFTAYLLYMIYIADGPHKTAHYAICTGFMALGMMIPGMFSGWLQEAIGYAPFFVWVVLATIPGFIVAALIPLDPTFGRKEDEPVEPEPTAPEETPA
jgi:MFS transporter, PAT family, beta-lactamase induction signal transducer AmpG